jgi:hypothetical protein
MSNPGTKEPEASRHGQPAAPLCHCRASEGAAPIGGPPRFLCDAHLGKLARRLRLLGFDTLFAHDLSGADPGDEVLADIAGTEGRILLTRDRALFEDPAVPGACYMSQAPVEAQLRALIGALRLHLHIAPFTRCTCCNGELEAADPADLAGRVPEGVLRRQARFWRCRGCGRVYWEGSHYRRMRELVGALMGWRVPA